MFVKEGHTHILYIVTPTKTVIFDQRVKILHDFGTAPHNFIAFNPQGRLIALAGFGNMSGQLDIFDRRTLNKVTTIDAPNTTFCEWSPDGRFLLTATLSPRLRVDNGIKIWHCTGPLLHVHLIDELYQASWRPVAVEAVAPFPNQMPPAPAPAPSVALNGAVKVAAPKAAGAYRPPGARGLATPSIYKREDEGGAAHRPSNGSATPPRRFDRSPGPRGEQNGHGLHLNGQGQGRGAERGPRRHIPGAPSSPSPVRGEGDKKAKKRKGKDDKRKDVNGNGNGAASPPAADSVPPTPRNFIDLSALQPTIVIESESVPPTPALDSAVLDPIAKKIRNLNKKVRCVYSIAL